MERTNEAKTFEASVSLAFNSASSLTNPSRVCKGRLVIQKSQEVSFALASASFDNASMERIPQRVAFATSVRIAPHAETST
jgi:hypothetical protein